MLDAAVADLNQDVPIAQDSLDSSGWLHEIWLDSTGTPSMDVSTWLRDLGLEDHVQAFQANHIDSEVLPRLTADDLIGLGITSVGHRRKLLDAIAALDQGRGSVAAEPIATAARPLEAERRQLTVLFCDLVGSTELAGRLDPEDLREVMRAYQTACAQVVRRFEGHLARFLGDGALAYFGWPRAHEDDAERAVRAGLQLVQDIPQLEPGTEVRLQARVGIATGQVVVGDLIGEAAFDKDAVSGGAPNLAARLQALATPGNVVISQATRRLVGGLFELIDLGPQRLKGYAEPLAAWRVEGEGRPADRFEALHGERLTPLVGREEEIALLLRRWRQAQGGEGQVVLLSGEPGIGKSRLLRALRQRLGDEPYTALSHYCSPYHTNSALYPVIALLERAARLERDDPPEQQLAKLEAIVSRSIDRLDQIVPLLAALLGVPTGARYPALALTPEVKRRIMQALLDQLAGLAARHPVLALYEDVHWIDPSTLELLGLVVERVQKLPVLVLITFRPESQPEREHVAGLVLENELRSWTAQRHVTTLTVSRLGRREGAYLVAQVTGEKPLPAAILEQIVEHADGVPLFVEELTKTVLESGLLADAGDHYELTGLLPPLALPATLHDSLMARLDRLPPVKEVAQIGAVIGREFSHELLAVVADRPEADLNASLDQLVQSELVFRRGASPDVSYSFKHALVKDAAYQSLLKSRRRQLHAQIATALEERFPETADAHPEVLARHFTEAGETDRAVDYWSKAGRRARAQSAYAEAIAHFDDGLKLPLAVRAERQLELQIGRAQALLDTRGHSAPEVGEAFYKARQLCRELGDPPETFPVLRGLHNFHWTRGEHRVALEIGKECLELAENQKDDAAEVLAHRLIGQARFMLGELKEGHEDLKCAIDRYDPQLHRASALAYGADSQLVARVLLSQLLWVVGYPDRAWREAKKALSDAERQESKYDLVHTMWQSLFTRFLRRDYQAVLDNAESVSALAREHGLDPFALSAEALNCGSRLAVSKRREHIPPFAKKIDARRATKAMIRVPILLGSLAEGLAANGLVKEALKTIGDAMKVTKQTKERWSEAELRRVIGQIRLAQYEPAKAERSFQRALGVARNQQAKSWELRAATSLARLWAEQGRRAKAHDLLKPVYGWFTEGVDTPDLKDAKALLDELA